MPFLNIDDQQNSSIFAFVGLTRQKIRVIYGVRSEEQNMDCREDSGPVAKIDGSGLTLLMEASFLGDVEYARALLGLKLDDVNQTELKSENPVLDSIKQSYALYFDAMRKTEFKFEGQGQEQGRTALMYAAFGGSGECLKLLLQHGADVNAHDSTGKTALMFAASAGSAYCLELLVKAGAEVNQLDSMKMSALSWATAGQNILNERSTCVPPMLSNIYEAKQLVRDIRGEFLSCVRILAKSGSGINCISTEMKTPLMYAIENGAVNLVQLLLNLGAQLKYEQLSVLAHSTEFGNASVRALFERLGKHYASLALASASDKTGNAQPPTSLPLKIAALRKSIPILLSLIAKPRTRKEVSLIMQRMKMASDNRRNFITKRLCKHS